MIGAQICSLVLENFTLIDKVKIKEDKLDTVSSATAASIWMQKCVKLQIFAWRQSNAYLFPIKWQSLKQYTHKHTHRYRRLGREKQQSMQFSPYTKIRSNWAHLNRLHLTIECQRNKQVLRAAEWKRESLNPEKKKKQVEGKERDLKKKWWHDKNKRGKREVKENIWDEQIWHAREDNDIKISVKRGDGDKKMWVSVTSGAGGDKGFFLFKGQVRGRALEMQVG